MRDIVRSPRLISFLLAFALLLSACVALEPEPVSDMEPDISSAPEPEPEPEEEPEPFPAIYTPPAILSLENTVRAYFEQMYLSYISFQDIDLSSILYPHKNPMYNNVTWSKLLNQRRRLICENDLCYVETENLPYSIEFISGGELTDGRLDFWGQVLDEDAIELMAHFVIKGEPGRAYPPWMAVNSQHTMFLRYEKGVWKIRFHYYPGSIRKYLSRTPLRLPSDEEMLADLMEEFSASAPDVATPGIPTGAALYDGKAAAEYARQHTESPNSDFYTIDDFMGNCANFTSQCVWSGFASGSTQNDTAMTNQWYAGSGGGSPAWENVEHFWNYLTLGSGMGSLILGGVRGVQPGDIIQTSSGQTLSGAEGGEASDERFNHSLVVVDADTLLLAQNSPGCFVYYSDLVNVDMRYARPVYTE